MTGRPSRSRPSATGSSRSSAVHCSSSSSSRSTTTRDFGLGTSTPTMSRPGIRATRIDRALILRARSSARLTSRFILTPGLRRTPYWVTTGPVVRPATSPSTLNSASVSSSRSCRAFSSFSPASIALAGGSASSPRSHTGPSSFWPGARRGSGRFGVLPRRALPSPLAADLGGASSRGLAAGSSSGAACASASALPPLRRNSPLAAGSLARAASRGSSRWRSSRCSGCQAKVARVSAETTHASWSCRTRARQRWV